MERNGKRSICNKRELNFDYLLTEKTKICILCRRRENIHSKITLGKSFSSICELRKCSKFVYFAAFLSVVLRDLEAKNLLIFLSTIETHFAKWYFLYSYKNIHRLERRKTSKKIEELSYPNYNIAFFRVEQWLFI